MTPRTWQLRIEADGSLSAVLTGTYPPVVVCADSLPSLRKQVSTTMTMLRARPVSKSARSRG